MLLLFNMAYNFMPDGSSGLKIRGWREPRAPLNSPEAFSNVCREPKDVLISTHKTFS